MDGLPRMVAHFAQVVNLGMAVVAGGDAVFGACCQDLVGLQLAVFAALVGVARLQEAAPRRRSRSCLNGWGYMSIKFSSPTTALTTRRRSSATGSPNVLRTN